MSDPAFTPDQIPEIALSWLRAGRSVHLATVVETWGSAPRGAGSQMVVDETGAMMGSVSGGCVEGAVVAEAMAGGPARILTYGVADEEAFAVGLACGGTIRVLLEPVGAGETALPESLLADLVTARAAGRAVGLVTDLATFARRLVAKGEDPAVDAGLRADRSAAAEGRFVAVHNPPLRLFVVGAVQIAQVLVPMARACGHAVTLIDPRSAFGSAARFPGEALVEEWPDEALPRLAPDARSAIVTLTHDAKLDDPAIAFALRSPVYYLGCLGSTRTHAKRLDRLRALGFTEAELARIHAPAGLNIGAKSPAEIALSILAEITQVLRKGA
ncbi:XdhC/CoxI family protein [bacterium]|nr:XdhC/CoxI family protein [bacterium]